MPNPVGSPSTRAAPSMPSPRSRAPAEPDYLFAYGTLMRGEPLHHVLARGLVLVGEGRVAGRLVSLGRYPGLVDGRARVQGELYRIDAPEVLSAVDRAEGYNFVR